MKLFIFTLLVVCVWVCSASIDVVTCQICEDVVQTWHDRYRCAGQMENFDSMRICDGPVFNCSDAPDAESCEKMRTEMQTDAVASHLWKAMRREGDAYAACTLLGQCAASKEEDVKTDCENALINDPKCIFEATCDAVNVCDNNCYVCNRLVKELPSFQESCKPPSAVIPNEVEKPPVKQFYKYKPFDTLPLGNSFVQKSATTKVTQAPFQDNFQYLTKEQLKARMTIDALFAKGAFSEHEYQALITNLQSKNSANPSPASFLETDAEIENTLDNQGMLDSESTLFMETSSSVTADPAEILEKCYAMWGELGASRRGRYYMSYKHYAVPEMSPDDISQSLGWDAHSVCKCLGKCPIQPGETLDLIHTCKYTRMHELHMKLAFPSVSNP